MALSPYDGRLTPFVRSRRLSRSALLVAASAASFSLVVTFGTVAQAAIVPTVQLGTVAQFSVLAGTTVTNTGPTTMPRDLGVSPGSAITGFPPGTVVAPGAIHAADAVALQAQSDLTTAYNDAANRPTNALTGAELGGQVLQGGVYAATATKGPLELTGTLTLDGAGNPSSVWIFQTDSTLTTATDSVVTLVNGASACNVFWQIGSSATLGTRTTFVGNLLTLTSDTLQDGVTVNGRVLARNGQVSLMNNTFIGPDCTPSPITTTSSIPTTVTTSPTTTTTGPTTTTVTPGPTTTTTLSGGLAVTSSTSTSTTVAAGGAAGPSTTVGPGTTSSTAGLLGAPAEVVTRTAITAPPVASTERALALTGLDPGGTAVPGLVALGAGVVLVDLGRRRKRAEARR